MMYIYIYKYISTYIDTHFQSLGKTRKKCRNHFGPQVPKSTKDLGFIIVQPLKLTIFVWSGKKPIPCPHLTIENARGDPNRLFGLFSGRQHVHSQPAGNFPAKLTRIPKNVGWLVVSTQLKNISQNGNLPK